ncbi:MAG: ferric iron uptake transcriptional regulator [Burkholderiales bacterium]|jgi:Fur family ferric uptake transcriptional regulator|nr:ferric iron uptake transcriptional regulator [Burkholderiales bacterium]
MTLTPQNLQSKGLKATLPRLKIIRIFETAQERHLSAEDIYRVLAAENSDIGLATVYRALTQFSQTGLLLRHHFEGDKAVYELNRGHHHDHIVCVHCGRIAEFFDPEIEKRQSHIAEREGFTIVDHALTLYGCCLTGDCVKERASESEKTSEG